MSSTTILWWFKLLLNLVVEGKPYIPTSTNDTNHMSASINKLTTMIRTGCVKLLFPVCDQYNLFYEVTILNHVSI